MTKTLAYTSFDGRHIVRPGKFLDPAHGPWIELIEKESPEAIRLKWLHAELEIMKDALRMDWRKTEDSPPPASMVGQPIMGLTPSLRGDAWRSHLWKVSQGEGESGDLAWTLFGNSNPIFAPDMPVYWMPAPCLPPVSQDF